VTPDPAVGPLFNSAMDGPDKRITVTIRIECHAEVVHAVLAHVQRLSGLTTIDGVGMVVVGKPEVTDAE
jgi:hypothetical protein